MNWCTKRSGSDTGRAPNITAFTMLNTVVLAAIASDIVDRLLPDCLYIIGPGTTTRAITSELGLAKTLIGVDVVRNRDIIAADVNESQLLDLLQKTEYFFVQ